MSECLFCRIVAGDEPARIVWEDNGHVAFLTPYPNTPGFTVVATRTHRGSYVLELAPPEFAGLLEASRAVGRLLDRAFGVARTALIAEGYGVDHAHTKLVPLHGTTPGAWRPIRSRVGTWSDHYEGYVSSHDGPRMSDAELDAIADRIRAAHVP